MPVDLRPKEFSTVKYLISAGSPKSLPLLANKEIMFIGRSNSGKSSLINALVNCKIAKTGRTPGRTQQINFFQLQSQDCLVDCPGYGFAAVSKSLKAQWPGLIKACLGRSNLVGLIWIMDIRHPLQKADLAVVQSFLPAPCPVHVVLNKSDKSKVQDRAKALNLVAKKLAEFDGVITLQEFSASKKTGLQKLDQVLLSWLQ